MATNTKDTDVETLRRDIDELKSALSGLTKDVKKVAEARQHEAASSARAKFEEMGQNASQFARRAAERGREGAEAVGDTVRERPVQSLLVAFGAGLLLAKLLDYRR